MSMVQTDLDLTEKNLPVTQSCEFVSAHPVLSVLWVISRDTGYKILLPFSRLIGYKEKCDCT